MNTYFSQHPEAEDFKVFIKDLTEKTWDKLIPKISDEIKSWNPLEIIWFNEVSTDH